MFDKCVLSNSKVLGLVANYNSLCLNFPMKQELLSELYGNIRTMLVVLLDSKYLCKSEFDELMEFVYNPARSDYYILKDFKVINENDRQFSFIGVSGNSPAGQELHKCE